MTESAIWMRDVTVRYGEVCALEQVSLDLAPGQVHGLIGVNGSGKSTLFKALMGMVRPDSGEIRVGGVSTSRARTAGAVAYVPQNETVDGNFPISVRNAVMTGRYGRMGLTRRPRKTDRDAVDLALERVDLTGYAERQIGRLSGGQRKRVFVARAIAQGANTLLLDEPFAGVDTGSEAMITRLLRELSAAGATIVVSTHDLAALPELADDAILLKRRVLMHGTPAEVLRPQHLARAFGLTPPAGGNR